MKIFLNERTIELLDSKPGNFLPDEMIVEYTSGKELKKAYKKFEGNDRYGKLVFWSDKADTRWKKDFYQLFTRIDAAGGLVKNEKGEILFIFRLGKWDLPKGKLDGNESPEEAATREVKEETGLTGLKVSGFLSSTFHIYKRKGKKILKQTWWFEMKAKSTQSLVPQTEEDITEARWIPVAELGSVLANTYGSIRDLVVNVTRDA
jgi:8-oxo-dGTP pyrophosphatase MutT (NUDIX family)